jgi:hypothetical protein
MPTSISVMGRAVRSRGVQTPRKQVNSSTTTRISQTWFASQIGPIASAINARCSSR